MSLIILMVRIAQFAPIHVHDPHSFRGLIGSAKGTVFLRFKSQLSALELQSEVRACSWTNGWSLCMYIIISTQHITVLTMNTNKSQNSMITWSSGWWCRTHINFEISLHLPSLYQEKQSNLRSDRIEHSSSPETMQQFCDHHPR